MKFGVRQITNVVFRAKSNITLGGKQFQKGQPVFYLDTAKTATMEQAATTVYAQGGRGNTRLIAWEGEKTLTFTVEDALLSPISLAMLSGAGLLKGKENEEVHFHQTSNALIDNLGIIDLTDAMLVSEQVCSTAPIYIMKVDNNGDLTGDVINNFVVSNDGKGLYFVEQGVRKDLGETITAITDKSTISSITIKGEDTPHPAQKFDVVTTSDGKRFLFDGTQWNEIPAVAAMVDYYVKKKSNAVSELQIGAENFAGYYYVEADTLFRTQEGDDLPANITFPNIKIQSNFTFSMASTGDPSTFTFTMDAFPGYTYFNKKKKILCGIQVAEDAIDSGEVSGSVFPHPTGFEIEESTSDSIVGNSEIISG